MATSSLHREGPELPPSRPTLATTHPQLASLGEQIIVDIQGIMEKGSRSFTEDDFNALTTQLLDVFNRVLDFVATTLATRGHYNNVAHWVEQTYKAVQKLGSVSSAVTTPPPTTSATSNKPT